MLIEPFRMTTEHRPCPDRECNANTWAVAVTPLSPENRSNLYPGVTVIHGVARDVSSAKLEKHRRDCWLAFQ